MTEFVSSGPAFEVAKVGYERGKHDRSTGLPADAKYLRTVGAKVAQRITGTQDADYVRAYAEGYYQGFGRVVGAKGYH